MAQEIRNKTLEEIDYFSVIRAKTSAFQQNLKMGSSSSFKRPAHPGTGTHKESRLKFKFDFVEIIIFFLL